MSLKILHVMTYPAGGAGIAARRIHNALLGAGVDSSILCRYPPPGPADERIHVYPRHLPRIWERVAARRGLPVSHRDRNAARRKSLGMEGVPFSWAKTDYDITSHPAYRSADIINLHWVSGFLDWRTFFERNTKPIVWTLHDMNPLLGGFHYESDRENTSSSVADEDSELAALKAEAIQKVSDLHIVTPSAWLGRLSAESKIFRQFPHSVIRYPIDGATWRPIDKTAARSVFGIPSGKRVLLTVAERTSDRRKGAELFKHAFEDPCIRESAVWVAAGDPAGLRGTAAHSIGFITDERLMALAYSAADLFVIPSREDNLPNVVIESHAVGTPVVGLPTGGIPEMIVPGMNGEVATGTSSHDLAEAIAKAKDSEFDAPAIRAKALDDYDPASIASEYLQTYNSIGSRIR